MVSSSLISQCLHLILGWPPSSSTDLYDNPEPAFQKGNAIGFGFGHTVGNVLSGWTRVAASLCLTFALFGACKLLDWVCTYKHPLNPSSISWALQQPHPDKHLTQIPWELSHPLSDPEVTGRTGPESQILVMATREEASWKKKKGCSGCVHFIMVIVNTKLLVLKEKKKKHCQLATPWEASCFPPLVSSCKEDITAALWSEENHISHWGLLLHKRPRNQPKRQ